MGEDDDGDDAEEEEEEEEWEKAKRLAEEAKKSAAKAKAKAKAPVQSGGGDPSAKHQEFIIAKVTSVEPMKKKKGSVLVGQQTGEDSATAIVTYENLEEDQLVIFAPEGSLVNGKPVKRAKVAGEWNEGVIC